MKILVTGVCGFVGSGLARALREALPDADVFGIDSLVRPGSEGNRTLLRHAGIRVVHGDLRCASDLEGLPDADWVIDAAANPSVLGGIDGRSTARQVLEHNLLATVNVLEYCRRARAGLILLSTSRVYSIPPLAALPVRAEGLRLALADGPLPDGISPHGINERFSTAPPVSLYGSTKLASEHLALEYGGAFAFPVWINRCGVLAGARQFATSEQGIFSYWVHAWRRPTALRYLGFGGVGAQVRDALHPTDLAELILRQMRGPGGADCPRISNVAGGAGNAMSLAELSAWCAARFGARQVAGEPTPRPFDIPWLVLDCRQAHRLWAWKPARTIASILDEIAVFAEQNPHWLELSSA
jgi:CDP-paratose 2-epimerase